MLGRLRHTHEPQPAARWVAMLVIALLCCAVSAFAQDRSTTDAGSSSGSGVKTTVAPPAKSYKGNPAGFEIDGDLLSNSGGLDWFPANGGTGVLNPSTCAGNPAQMPAFLGHDNVWRNGVDAKFKTRSNKNQDNIDIHASPWNWSTKGGNPQKNDITEIYTHSRSDNAGNVWVMMAAGTRAAQGDNHTDFEFNQAGVVIQGVDEGIIYGLGPNGGRTIGDLLVSVDEVNGGRQAIPSLRRWDGTQFVIIPESVWTGKLFVANNETTAPTPCGAVVEEGTVATAYEPHQFFEVAFRGDLLANPNFGGSCGSPATIMVKTRSSQSWTAELKDFALGGFGSPGLPACVIAGASSVCPGKPIQLCGPDGTGFTYSWSTGATTKCITVTTAGNYTLTLNAPGCPPSSCSHNVTGGTLPSCDITGTTSLCQGQSGQLCGPDLAGLTYAWSTGATTRCITINGPGTFSLTTTNGCGSSTCSRTVTSGSGPACIITGPNTICSGVPTEICGPDGAGLTYMWSTGATTRCISVTAQATYTLTVTGGSCGPVTCSKALTASTTPTCSITGPDSICANQTAQLCGPEGFQGQVFTYAWSTGATTRCITINGAGSYTLTVSSPTCGSSTCTKLVTLGMQVACSIIGPDDLDPDSTGVLCGPNGSGLSYVWSTGATTRCITIPSPGTYTLTVTSAACGNSTSTCSKTVTDRPTSSCRCSLFYPDSSSLPRSLQAFHESGIIRAVVPGRSGCPTDSTLRIWYNDEFALAAGIRRVVVYTSPTDSTVNDFATTPSPVSPTCVVNPALGATNQSGDLTGNDTAVDGGRPIWPVLYVTDITLNKDSRAGDWQFGSTVGIPARQVCGVWTYGVRRVYKYLGNAVTIQMDPSPAQNHWNLGGGSAVPPGGFGAYADEGYGAEVSWNVNQFGFVPGHRYRLYTILHDGDQQSSDGGDAGHACTRVVVAQNLMMTAYDDGSGTRPPVGDYMKPVMAANSLPQRFEFSQNFPNPFAAGARTTIAFALPERSQVRIGVYTVAGQRVGTLANGAFEAGRRTIEWDGTGANGRTLAPGMYVCKMEASALKTGQFVQMRKMLIIK